MTGRAPERSTAADASTTAAVERVFRVESRRVLATLIRLLGDFDLAEEALGAQALGEAERFPNVAFATPAHRSRSATKTRSMHRGSRK